MSKVTFEFDENEDRYDVNLIVNRHKLVTAVNELSDLFRRIYNGKIYDEKDLIYVKEDGCVATEEDYKKVNLEGTYLTGGETYLRQKFIETELDKILDDVKPFLYF